MHPVNSHIHTPYSFSAFRNVEEAVSLAVQAGIRVLGINDFFTTEGYDEFYTVCKEKRVYPLFNIEFIGLEKDQQQNSFRFNDPNNEGRIYVCGKGLMYPQVISDELKHRFSLLQNESNEHVKKMIVKCNELFASNFIEIQLDYETIKSTLAKNLVRERHIAKAIRIIAFQQARDSAERKQLLQKIYSGKETKVDVENNNAVENEIRNNLLKNGGSAFVPENENGFLSLSEIKEIIIQSGGIPCYPVLLDFNKGNFTEFESDWERMHTFLSQHNIRCIELIPSRNDKTILEDFVNFFHSRNYIILFGTEHNTPELTPMRVDISESLQKISYESTCVIAAHQYRVAKKEEGFLDSNNSPKADELNSFIEQGNGVIEEWIN
jgi:hypothetical protein